MPRKPIDITNQKFGKLTVLYRNGSTKSGNAKWHCKCECGNECDVVGSALRNGHTKSCGCNIKIHMAQLGRKQGYNNVIDINGQTFGQLTVIDRVYDIDRHKYKCLCKCSCGNQVLVDADKLKSGHTKSCGCISSYGEKSISNFLTENNYNFKQQVNFDDCRNPKTNYKLRFDFGLYSNGKLKFLLEYNGKQHYDKTKPYYSNEGIERDKIKQEYCKKNNIPLYIIKYDDDITKKLQEILEENKV